MEREPNLIRHHQLHVQHITVLSSELSRSYVAAQPPRVFGANSASAVGGITAIDHFGPARDSSNGL